MSFHRPCLTWGPLRHCDGRGSSGSAPASPSIRGPHDELWVAQVRPGAMRCCLVPCIEPESLPADVCQADSLADVPQRRSRISGDVATRSASDSARSRRPLVLGFGDGAGSTVLLRLSEVVSLPSEEVGRTVRSRSRFA